MSARETASRIRARLGEHGLNLPAAQVDVAEAYIGLLTKWNKTVNLTALALNPISDEAIDRLLVEPFLAAQYMASGTGLGASLLIDVGSGSGSPAIPIKIARSDLALAMIESKSRKSAFLREAIRQLGLDRAEVATGRIEQLLTEPRFREAASWVSVRAVRADRELWRSISALLKATGRVLWFRSEVALPDVGEPGYATSFDLEATQSLIQGQRSELAILRRRAAGQAL